jgi:putative ABC transport system permease protein
MQSPKNRGVIVKLIWLLGWRNLLRYKRRNFLLGIGIAFAMMMMVVVGAFTSGSADLLLNEFVADLFGHLVIMGTQANHKMIGDRYRIEQLIRETIPAAELVSIAENLVLRCRAVGNGEVDDLVIHGEPLRSRSAMLAGFNRRFTLVEGDFNNFFSEDIAYPVLITAEKARSLNVKVNDPIRLRLPLITGQIQAARLTVVAIVKANKVFNSLMLIMENTRLKQLLGYQTWQTPCLKVKLRNPARTVELYAKRLRQRLQPKKLVFSGRVGQVRCQLMAVHGKLCANPKSLAARLNLPAGVGNKIIRANGVLINGSLAQKYNLKCGDLFDFTYRTKFGGSHREKLRVKVIGDEKFFPEDPVILANAEHIFPIYNKYRPQRLFPLVAAHPFYSLLVDEWKIFERSNDFDSLQKKYLADRRNPTSQARLDVITMYQGASQVLRMESTLRLVTGVAFLILFLIVQIGVVNSLRITILERTREIGTIRAIGMQKSAVRQMLLLENLLLTAVACGVGIGLALIGIRCLGAFRFDSDHVLNLLLKDHRLYFKVNPVMILNDWGLIMILSGITVYLPAYRAAKLSAVAALRHYE